MVTGVQTCLGPQETVWQNEIKDMSVCLGIRPFINLGNKLTEQMVKLKKGIACFHVLGKEILPMECKPKTL